MRDMRLSAHSGERPASLAKGARPPTRRGLGSEGFAGHQCAARTPWIPGRLKAHSVAEDDCLDAVAEPVLARTLLTWVLMVAWPRMRLAAISSSFGEISVRPVQAEEVRVSICCRWGKASPWC